MELELPTLADIADAQARPLCSFSGTSFPTVDSLSGQTDCEVGHDYPRLRLTVQRMAPTSQSTDHLMGQ